MAWPKGRSRAGQLGTFSPGRTAWNKGLKTGPLSVEHRQTLSEIKKKRIKEDPEYLAVLLRNGQSHRRRSNLEIALRELLKKAGFEFEEQIRFGRYIVDAWLPNDNLVFEADGSFWWWHKDKNREVKRDEYLCRRGVVAVIHLDEHDLAPWIIREGG